MVKKQVIFGKMALFSLITATLIMFMIFNMVVVSAQEIIKEDDGKVGVSDIIIPTNALTDRAGNSLDNIKEFTKDIEMEYGKIDIKNSFLWFLPTSTIETIELKKNTNICGQFCSAEKEITIYTDTKLIDSIKFMKLEDNGNWVRSNIRNYKFYIRSKQTPYEVEDTKWVCKDTGFIDEKNGSAIQDCSNQVVGSHTEYEDSWIEYNYEVMPTGTYYVKLEGEKRPEFTYDWIITSQGKEISEWSVWGSSVLATSSQAYYNFDGQGSLLNENGAFNLTAGKVGTNGVSTYGVSGYSDNDSKVSFNGVTTASYTFWFKGTGQSKQMMGMGKGGGNQGFYIQNDAVNRLQAWARNSADNYAFITPASLYDGNWHHVGVIWDITNATTNSRIRFYIDGALDITGYSSGWNNQTAINTGAGVFYLGSDYLAANNYDAIFDEVGVWNKSLTLSDITTLYNSGTGLAYPFSSSITLNSPVNNYGTNISSINFNCSSSTVGATLVNMSLMFNNAINQTFSKTGTTNNSIFTKSMSEGQYNWTCQACDSDGVCSGGENRSVSIDTTAPKISLIYPASVVNYAYLGQNISLNYSITDLNINTCWYNYNGSDKVIPCTANSTFILTSQKNMTIYANDTAGNLNSSFFSWDYSIFENVLSYSKSTIAGSTENFIFNMTPSTIYTSISPFLIYNGTSYTMDYSGGVYSKSIIIPNIAPRTNNTFYISTILSNSSGTITINSTLYTQNISSLLMDNCSLYTNKVISFNMVDEETLANISGTINVLAKFYSLDRSILVNTYNGTLNYDGVTPVSICLANLTSQYSLDYVTQFYSNQSLYFIKYKSMQNFVLSNLTSGQNITLYDLLYNSGNIFQLRVRGLSDNTNVLVDIQKQYLSKSEFISTESYISDSDGIAIGHLVTSSAVYNFVLSRNGVILGSFNNYQVKCNNAITGDCYVILNVYDSSILLPNFKSYGNIDGAFTLVKATRTLQFTFSTTDGQAHTVDQQIVKFGGSSNITICNISTYGTSGTLTCVIPESYGNTTFMARTYVHSDKLYINTYIFSFGKNPNFTGVEVLLEMLLYSTLVLMFLSDPILVILGAVLGFTLAMVLLFLGSDSTITIISTVIFFIAAGAIIIAKLGRRM